MERQITFRLPEELYQRLVRDAESDHRTVSQQIRMLLERHYRQEAKR